MANKATKPAAKPANATVTTDNAALANVAVSPVAHEGPAHKYGKAAATVPCAGNSYKLTALGADTNAGKSGRVTVMALVAQAARAAGATTAKPVTGLAIVLAMQTTPEIAAAYKATKAGKYAPKGALPCAAWCSGYVVGAARSAAGLLAKVSG